MIRDHFEAFRQELLGTGMVENVAASESPITSINTTNSGFHWQGKDPDMTEEFWTSSITHEFGKTIDWKIEEGRDFSTNFATDTAGFIINQTAAEYMGLSDPVGEVVRWGDNGEWSIIGVVDDMITRSPYEPVQQMIFFLRSKRNAFNVYRNVLVKLRQDVPVQDALVKVGDVFNRYDPNNPFEYSFADDDYAQKFANEMRIGKLAFIFAGLAILISCLGLFGLIAYVAERRTKEIGIRKVLGASIISVWQMLSKDFVLLVAISSVLAIPLAYLAMSSWLENFAYRTELSWWIFVASVLSAVFLTLITVSFQAIKAANANPVKSLRTE
jgi:ABC-type antimicrobial peptide transport system permease subunit